MRLGRTLLAVAVLGAPAAAQAQAEPCELHVWTTGNYNAVFHGAMPVVGGVRMYLDPMEEAARAVEAGISQADQARIVEEVLASGGRFAGYRRTYYPGERVGKHGNWIIKTYGEGGRDVPSESKCYAELHVVMVTLFRTAISKKIQTAFVYREFGDSAVMVRRARDAGSTGAPNFLANGDSQSAKARSDLHAAFAENLRIFLRKKKMRPARGGTP